jgi:arylsulfatase A-like enzyme
VISGRNRVFPLGPEKVTLAEMLRDRGYHTGGFVANFANLDRAFGFAQGFGHYEDLPGPLLRPVPHAIRFVQQFVPTFVKEPFRSAGDINAAALAWLDRLPAGRPAFVFLNYLEPHHWLATPPYDRWSREVPGWRDLSRKGFFTHSMPVHLSEAERAFITASYDGQVASMDADIGALMDALKKRTRYENAIIIVTADHGELLGEHDLIGHGGRMMYDGLLHIPMVVKLPGANRPRGDVKEPVQLVDIVPTVLTTLGIAVPPDVQGQQLQHVTHPIVAEEDINPEFVSHYGDIYDRALRVIYDGSYKLISTSKGQRMLFDLARDGNETDDLGAREPERVAAMESRLEAVMNGMQTKVAAVPIERGRWRPGAGLLVDFE